MKKRTFTSPISFFVSPAIYAEVKRITDDEHLAISELVRMALEEYLARRGGGPSLQHLED
jgi:hypothetical protein